MDLKRLSIFASRMFGMRLKVKFNSKSANWDKNFYNWLHHWDQVSQPGLLARAVALLVNGNIAETVIPLLSVYDLWYFIRLDYTYRFVTLNWVSVSKEWSVGLGVGPWRAADVWHTSTTHSRSVALTPRPPLSPLDSPLTLSSSIGAISHPDTSHSLTTALLFRWSHLICSTYTPQWIRSGDHLYHS